VHGIAVSVIAAPAWKSDLAGMGRQVLPPDGEQQGRALTHDQGYEHRRLSWLALDEAPFDADFGCPGRRREEALAQRLRNQSLWRYRRQVQVNAVYGNAARVQCLQGAHTCLGM
jgi:hypothetical protein